MKHAVALAALVLLTACDSSDLINLPDTRPDIEAVTLTVGERHACGLSSGTAYCWGRGEYGELGSEKTGTLQPEQVAGGHTFASITAGAIHTCALDRDGAAYCWGFNRFGQLGTGNLETARTPVPVSGGLRFISLSAGPFTTCGVTTAGDAYCWGRGGTGALGAGDLEDRRRPQRVAGGLKWSTISTGLDHTCGLTRTGEAYCWGVQILGALGNGENSGVRDAPSAVMGGLRFRQISAGAKVTCAMTVAGGVHCWGTNVDGELGQGRKGDYSASPASVPGTYASISVEGNVCGTATDGVARCWGRNDVHQSGVDTGVQPVLVPTAITSAARFRVVQTGIGGYSCGITTTGAAICWGYGYVSSSDGRMPEALEGGVVFDG